MGGDSANVPEPLSCDRRNPARLRSGSLPDQIRLATGSLPPAGLPRVGCWPAIVPTLLLRAFAFAAVSAFAFGTCNGTQDAICAAGYAVG